MKIILLVLLLPFSLVSLAQDAKLNETSVMYKGKHFTVGDVIELGYGSGTNKDFAFVKYGKSLGGMNIPKLFKNADADWSKAEIEIEKISTVNGVIWARGSAVNRGKSLGAMLGNKIFINIEGAVDNNEIKGTVTKGKQQQKEKNNNQPDQNAPAPGPSIKGKKENNNTADAPPPTPKSKTPGNKSVANNKGENLNSTAKSLPFAPTNAKGKLYFRTMSWYSASGGSLDLNWIFLGNDGTFVRDPKNGVNPINYAAELQNNADNVGKYKIEGKKLHITLNKNRTATWSLEYDEKAEIKAMDAGIVNRPKAMPANYKLNGQYAASAVLPNVSSVQTFVFSPDGTFTLNKQGTVSTKDMSAISKSDSKGTYKIAGNTLWLNFDNGETHIGIIWIWDLDKGKRNLVINRSYFPQER